MDKHTVGACTYCKEIKPLVAVCEDCYKPKHGYTKAKMISYGVKQRMYCSAQCSVAPNKVTAWV